MSALRRSLLTAAGAVAAGAAAVAFTATPASAAVGYYAYTQEASGFLSRAGHNNFDPDGDWFYVCDNWSDGAGVAGYWKVGSTGTVHKIYNGGGIGTCAESNQDFAESATVYVKACIQDNGDVKESTCSAWVKGYADGVP
jgi:hypothetical protein